MKKLLALSITLALFASLFFGSIALAADPTTVDVTWDGTGIVTGDVDTGDALTNFHSEGSNHIGEFHATDYNINHYGYGVDDNVFSLETSITGTGWAELDVNRTDSGPYGPAGQQSYTYVGVNNGNATLQNRVSTNYASMKDCNYGWNANNHITVTEATAYTLIRWMDSDSSVPGGANSIRLDAKGNGNANLDCMSSEANASQVRLGWGCGCYTNADFTATGTGAFQLQAAGNTESTTAMAPGMTGASSFSFLAGWTNGTFNVSDYSTTAK